MIAPISNNACTREEMKYILNETLSSHTKASLYFIFDVLSTRKPALSRN